MERANSREMFARNGVRATLFKRHLYCARLMTALGFNLRVV